MCFLNNKTIVMFLVSLLLVFLFAGCDPVEGNYPYDKGTQWESKDPSIIICYSTEENGGLYCEAILRWDGKELPVDILFSPVEFEVSPEGETAYEKRLLSGEWGYEKGDLVLYVENDNIFDFKYEKIVFSNVTGDVFLNN